MKTEKKTVEHPYHFQMIPARQISIDTDENGEPLYQRGKVDRTIKQMRERFDYHLVNPVKVSFTDGKYSAMDGQNTLLGLIDQFGLGYMVPCLVYYDLPTAEDRARVFGEMNKPDFRKSLTAAELWKSEMFSKNETTMDIEERIEKFGYKAKGVETKGTKISAIAALRALNKDLNIKQFNEVFDIISKVWPNDELGVCNEILRGMGRFVEVFEFEYDKKRLIKKLKDKAQNPKNVNEYASGKGKAEKKYGRAITEIYNSDLGDDSKFLLDDRKI